MSYEQVVIVFVFSLPVITAITAVISAKKSIDEWSANHQQSACITRRSVYNVVVHRHGTFAIQAFRGWCFVIQDWQGAKKSEGIF